jgi:transposase
VLKTGITWNQLPAGVVGRSGVTCWRRLPERTGAGVWPALHELLLAELRAAGLLARTACRSTPPTCTHSMGDHVGPSPVNRGHPGSKHHLIVDAHGIPLVTLTGGHRHDVTQLLPLLDAVAPIRGRRGRSRRKPREPFAGRRYDFDKYRRLLRERAITPRITRRGVAHGYGLGTVRWVVERGFAWLHAFKTKPEPTGAAESTISPRSPTNRCSASAVVR